MCPVDEEIYPTTLAVKTEDGKILAQPLENMAPALPPSEWENEMIIPIFK
jgi:hypothetical protein